MNINHNLSKQISKLPMELQKKIYIITWRLFWRNYVPITAKIPSWYYNKINVDQIIFGSRINNIHFLHLPFNILPENKKWIMGCQCDFCFNYNNRTNSCSSNNSNFCISREALGISYKKIIIICCFRNRNDN